MKPTIAPKKRPAKRTVAHTDNPIVGKLLRLKYRMNDWYKTYGEDTRADKTWVMNLISEVRDNGWTKLAKEDMLLCNSLWRKYD